MKNEIILKYLNPISKKYTQPYNKGISCFNKTPFCIAASSGSYSTKKFKQTKKIHLDELSASHLSCQKCPLATQGRKQVVFGSGNAEAKLMFIGEGPGRDEDIQGLPFVGRAGQLLNKIIEAMGMKREDVYISNAVKCRPPGNRTPLPLEVDTCKNLLLFKEIDIIQPKIICTLGSPATKALLGEHIKISQARGIFAEFKGIPVMPTYHPAYLLRNPVEKRTVWEDMKKIMNKLNQFEMNNQK